MMMMITTTTMKVSHFPVVLFNKKSILFQFDLMLSEDGSGRGAALVAAVATRAASMR